MVSLHLLGPLQVENDGKIVTSFRSNRAVALLAYLVCRQRPVSRDELVELIWPDRPEAKGQANLRWALNYLGTLLPGCWENNRQTICFLAERAVVDLNRLRLSYEQAAWSDLTAVLANIQGDFMHGFYFDESPEFEIWLLAQREHWQHRVVQALQSLIAYHTKRGEYSQGLDLATRLIILEPWREEVHRLIMTLQVRTGQRSAALAQYKTCFRIIGCREFGRLPCIDCCA